MSFLTGNKKTYKEIWKEIDSIRKQYGMSEYSFHKDVKMMQQIFKKNISLESRVMSEEKYNSASHCKYLIQYHMVS